ncbi:MAG TPA: peptide chain release factor N(5)-glutamine methyltransferase, partial [Candidatus Saccharimonadales bacterium]|nr:peptide chain release factor N(5)-glutamine methyltransferase [Candidatus Saccharimonadales bacterium]
MTLAQALTDATKRLQAADITTARLDSLVLLSHLVDKDKSWVLAHTDEEVTTSQQELYMAQLTRRESHEPLAYILGYKEFYGHDFIVTSAVLIPRPETESLVDLLADLQPQPEQRLLDVGTGSGAIAISCKLRWPDLAITATDISPAALAVAAQNASALHADITLRESNLLQSVGGPYDYIVANLPYVTRSWQRSPETNYEPAEALFASDDGLALIKKLMTQ